jgi:hypothetical protein
LFVVRGENCFHVFPSAARLPSLRKELGVMSKKFQQIGVLLKCTRPARFRRRFSGRLNDDRSHLFQNGMQYAQSGLFVPTVFRSVDLRFENRNVPEGRSYYHALTVVNPKAVEIDLDISIAVLDISIAVFDLIERLLFAMQSVFREPGADISPAK